MFFLSHSVREGPETLLFYVFSVFSVFQKERGDGEGGGSWGKEKQKNLRIFCFFSVPFCPGGPGNIAIFWFSSVFLFSKRKKYPAGWGGGPSF